MTSLTLILLNISRINMLNNTNGYSAREKALRIAGEAVYSATRKTDIFIRIGSEKFALVLQNSDKTAAEKVTGRAFNYLNDKELCKPENKVSVKCSIGVCILNTEKIPADPAQITDKYFDYMSRKVLNTAYE
jgi:diguanylate cyclase (GGDEF)-like protein